MCNRTWFFLLIVLTASPALAKAPVGDWDIVEQDVPRGWEITVVTSLTFPCVFARATADELICSPVRRSGNDSGEIHVRRERIREIRAERREGANMLAGAAGGGGLGSILGALLVAGGRGPAAYTFALSGAVTAAHSGRVIHILRGKVIYRPCDH